jgi:hypothetical protein
LEQLTRWDQLVCEEQFDLHAIARDLVEHFNCGHNYLGRKRGAGVGLHAPSDRILRERWRCQSGGWNNGRALDKFASRSHVFSPWLNLDRFGRFLLG